ncbi:NADP(+)-dependent dehydrogenase [Penicillium argentinense]|uniref:NADP(+)-dependent dehydrogenase n=1 Tax=Penicillium argentinense TaxID=1131581 RepID=A0A9W9K394_9EURO|nr:NADP(+)-dependent dehydrogenase [Penicillium argentinense]KAJ5090527.1 NADP(+)-dependent dehydrogenase [Penicillium argentinense]
MSHVVLITGANRGIGKGLLAHYLAQPNTTVIGTVRDASSEKAQDLEKLPKGEGSGLIVVPLDINNPSSVTKAVSIIQTQHHIEHIDVVIANAGVCTHWGPVQEMADEDVISHFEVNTLGPLRLFKATASLLEKASTPKLIYISTLLASFSGIEQIPTLTAAYGMSKVAGNFLVKKIDAENKHLITLSVDPGLVQTDMGSRNAQLVGLEKAPVTVEDTVRGITNQIDAAKKSTTSGHFVNSNGESVAW